MIRKTTPERLSFFSDAIFAVLITVLVLDSGEGITRIVQAYT